MADFVGVAKHYKIKKFCSTLPKRMLYSYNLKTSTVIYIVILGF